MKEALLSYYERELRFIRRSARDFAERYPAIAGQLLLEPDKCEDPHVERLIESFAMLTARVQLKLDSGFTEITEAFLGLLYPEYLAPVPSATIVQLQPDTDRADATAGIDVPRHSLLQTKPLDGVRCRFRTCYDTTLWPVQVTDVNLISLGRNEPSCPADAVAAIRIVLRTSGSQSFADLPLDRLRFFIDGDNQLVHQIYETVFNRSLGLVVRPAVGPGATLAERAPAVFQDATHLRQVGFVPDEMVFGTGGNVALGYRLLQEYFAFPEKYQFVEFTGLEGAQSAMAGNELEILVLLDELPLDLEGQLSPDTFRLGCTPAVNLFPYRTEPIRLTQTASEYRVVPDNHAPLGYEVHSLLDVEAVEPGAGKSTPYRPLYAFRHGDPAEKEPAFWQSRRQPSLTKNDDGSEVTLTLVDRQANILAQPPADTLIVRALCTNRDLPAQLPVGQQGGDFFIEGQPGVSRVVSLRKPTPTRRNHLNSEGHWRLISLLCMNHLSLAPDENDVNVADGLAARYQGPVALRELLSLLDFNESTVSRQRISGLLDIRSRRVLRQISVEGSRVFARGLEVTLALDESKYTGSGVFLFASLLERFLGLYCSMNSFTETVATVRQREGVLRRWQPRVGGVPVL